MRNHFNPFDFLLLLLLISTIQTVAGTKRTAYIVYLGAVPKGGLASVRPHHDLLATAIGDHDLAKESLIQSYRRSFNGFAAMLHPEEAKKLSDMADVVSVFPNRYRKLHTTRSWNFLGLDENAKRNLKFESDVVVGLLDTGIWPNSPSFNDKGLGPVPSRWKGTCGKFAHFSGCNKKVIGARYYRFAGNPGPPEILSPIDMEGHGTHTSSTVAGVSVRGASLYGLANGTARGGVPAARIAMYKVCWVDMGCADVDILAAFDDAISDGVDILSVSVGGGSVDYLHDPIAIGSFHAMANGVVTSCSAGNDGPMKMSVVNIAPWIITVAASTTDRQFKTRLGLGNGKNLPGISINTFSPGKGIYPLISGEDAANKSSHFDYGSPSACDAGTLDRNKVKGKIVYCVMEDSDVDSDVEDMGGVGTIIESNLHSDTAFSFLIPAAVVTNRNAKAITSYMKSTKYPKAVIYKSQAVKVNAPVIPSFSSRGPNYETNHILKPDIAAPGLEILAAYSRMTSVTGYPTDKRVVDYNVVSGTSMACPHVSAAAAYVKSFHPTWSPSAIKSALITTAKRMSQKMNPEAEFAYGAGQLNPTRAADPGLVYEAIEEDYIRFLCKEGYNGTSLQVITGGEIRNCSAIPKARGADGLNYPSMQLQAKGPKSRFGTVFKRTVTNVGPGKSVYQAIIESMPGLSVNVFPANLTFSRPNQKRSFRVTVKGKELGDRPMLSASLIWDDSKHKVRSPIVVHQIIGY